MAEFWPVVSDLITAASSLAAVVVAVVVYRGQNKLSRELAARDERLAQRQLIVPLWEYLSSVPDIAPNDKGQYVEPNLIRAVNTLELVALCCEGKMIDEQVIIRTFSDVYVRIYDAIKMVPKIQSRRGISGADLLRENRAAMAFYDRLVERLKNADKIQP
jgi:hypothetical protein